MSDILETIDLWFAMNPDGPFTDERQIICDAGEEIASLRQRLAAADTEIARLRNLVQCCERDHNFDGDCDRHPKGLRGERDELQQKLTVVENKHKLLLDQLEHTGIGEFCRRMEELTECRQQLAAAEKLLQRCKLTVLNADSELSAYGHGRSLDRDTAIDVAYRCRQSYKEIVAFLLEAAKGGLDGN